ncbi:MAG: PD40 domain-containing protein [Actinobacteria bacterium]|nr:PD40 domain-containing protein [Actinomycetota bacterium]
MRCTSLLVVLMVAGCAGGDDASVSEQSDPAVLEVQIVARGQRSAEARAVTQGRLGSRQAAIPVPRVFSRAGSEPDRQSIVWEEIYLREPDGSERRLTSDRNADLAPQLLGDGRAAFVSCVFHEGDVPPDCMLDAIDPATEKRETLLDDLGLVFHGELSPDERRFLFTRLEESGGVAGLFVRDLGGGGESRLVDGEAGTWSPDGRRIAFVSDRDENGRCLFHDCVGHAGEIYIANADGTDEQRLTQNPQVDAAPEWSGDGEWIVFGRIADEEGDWDLHAVRADGACERQLTDTPRWEVGAVWHGGGHGGLSC